MNIIVASSRGAKLNEHGISKDITVSVTSGGTLNQLKDQALKITAPSSRLGRRDHIYFVGGVPDITKLVKNYRERYRECIYDEEPSVTAERHLAAMKDCQRCFLERGALPIFSTIPKVHLTKYNVYNLLNSKTSSLKLTDKYSDMQTKLDTAIDIINQNIYELNKKIQITTPFLHHSIRERRGVQGNRYIAYRWEKLYDGLHASVALLPKWADILNKAMALNNMLEDLDEQDPPKRYVKHSTERWSLE